MIESQDQTPQTIADLRQTLATRSFKIVYQPILDLRTKEVLHYEALVRFFEGASTFGTVLLAEEIGLAEDFDLAICGAVIEMFRRRQEAGHPVDVAINLSGQSLQSLSFAEKLEQLLETAPGDDGTVLIEVTETAEIQNLRQVNEVLQRLRSLGHPVCIDDFGANSSVFHYLAAFDVDYVKIDGSFTQAIETGGVERSILNAILQLCHEREATVIAEQVENEAQVRLLIEAGIRYGQGYLLGRPNSSIPH